MHPPLWTPSTQRIEKAQITRFIDRINGEYVEAAITDYAGLHGWALQNPELFWSAVWDFGEVRSSVRTETVLLDGDRFPGARWFPEAKLNFAENLLRRTDEHIALVSLLEDGSRREISYAQLYRQVAGVASAMRAHGIIEGDRVAGFMPNVAETVVAMLAAASIGAVWSSCSPDFGLSGVIDRFGQIKPRILFAADGYFYNGKTCDSM